METLFEGLTASEIEYLSYLHDRGYFDGVEMLINLDTSSDYRVEKLIDGGYIVLGGPGPYRGSTSVTITGKGIAALVDYDKYQNQIQPLNDQISALNKIAEALQKQVDLIEKTASESRKEAQSAHRQTIFASILAIIGLLPDIIPYFYDLLKKFLSLP